MAAVGAAERPVTHEELSTGVEGDGDPRPPIL
jgi:hypothetical protein